MDNTKSVFISYSSKDIIEVNKVINMLNDAGIKYWKAPEMIPAGSNYAREIPKAISECAVFLLIISDEAQKSIWVEKEIDCAINNRKTIVPFKIFWGGLTDMFSFYLNNVQTIYYLEDKESAMKQLEDRLKFLLSEEKSEGDFIKRTVSEEPNAPQIQTSIAKDKRKQFNPLTINAQPVFCNFCNGGLEFISSGTYKCKSCSSENFDYFHLIRNYLDKAGPRSITDIVAKTGVPRRSVEHFLNQEMLEIPKGSPIMLACAGCGAAIRTGRYCDSCKDKMNQKQKDPVGSNKYRLWRDNDRRI